MSNKPIIPKGTRDFSPQQMERRNYIFDTITNVFKKYGFQQIETPAMENLTTLVGTGGDESDKLIFKILNSGDYLAKVDEKVLCEKKSPSITKLIAEKALHYDLTVPFARYVVQNQNNITFPFKRFQIQPVWRADRPQKGRYREFYQCDADIIGSDSLINEIDLIQLIDNVFTELFQSKLHYTLSINNRKILAGIAETYNVIDRLMEMTVIIDKIDKIGIEGVSKELSSSGFPEEIISNISSIINFDNNKEKLQELESLISTSEQGKKGIQELKTIFEKLDKISIKTANIKLDPTLARGLGYYTGTIIEVKVNDFPSICGGGRYDDLTGKFGLKNVSGVGISFGADRIYDVLLDNNLYPPLKNNSTQVLFISFGEKEQDYCLPLLSKLREAGIKSEIYPDLVKMKRQMNFANNKEIQYVVMVGSNEMETNQLTVKNMESGEQENLTIDQLIQKLT